MNIVFLDIDGVLNTDKTCIFYDNEMIVEDDKLLLLKNLWKKRKVKSFQFQQKKITGKRKTKTNKVYTGAYLDEKFSEYGLTIYDKTIDDGIHRGLGVLAWKSRNNTKNIVVLDDNEEGYDAITKAFYLVKISGGIGLTEQNLEKAKEILNK